jgi:phosphoglycolate phosphatase
MTRHPAKVSDAMKRYDLAIFDFDGTLADSAAWLRSTINHVARRYGFRQLADAELEELRGQRSIDIIRYLGIPAWKMPFIARYMRQLVARDAHLIGLFGGVDTLLSRLAERDVAIAIVTSNSETNVRRILGDDNSRRINDYACGASLFGKTSKFHAVIKRQGARADRTIAIGDEARDIDAARKAGLAVGAVSWGYATIDLLRAQQPDYLFSSMDDIRRAIVG